MRQDRFPVERLVDPVVLDAAIARESIVITATGHTGIQWIIQSGALKKPKNNTKKIDEYLGCRWLLRLLRRL